MSDPPDAMYVEEDTLIEDPTLVAVLEHAIWRPDAHPVLHVPLPYSRRASQYGDTDSEADDSILSPVGSTAGGNPLSQPLLADGQHGHHHNHSEDASLCHCLAQCCFPLHVTKLLLHIT